MLISCVMHIRSIASSVCRPATCLHTQSIAGYSSVMMKSASIKLSIESGAIKHECLARCPHALVRPMTCANPSHVNRIASNTPRRMSPFSSYATVMTPVLAARAVSFFSILIASFLTAFIVTFDHDTAPLNIEENISRRLLDAGALDANGVAGAACVFLLRPLMNLSNTNELASGPSALFSTIVSPVVYWNTRAVPSKTGSMPSAPGRPSKIFAARVNVFAMWNAACSVARKHASRSSRLAPRTSRNRWNVGRSRTWNTSLSPPATVSVAGSVKTVSMRTSKTAAAAMPASLSIEPHFGMRCSAGHSEPIADSDNSVLRNMPALSSLQHVNRASSLPSVVQSWRFGCTK
jgi:hypothetical protein